MSGERYTPTPEDIREACEEIRREWSEFDERSRRVVAFQPARVPGVDCSARVAVPS